MPELTRESLIDSQEDMDRMECCLTDLEAHPTDSALLAEIFRAVHTIKGTTPGKRAHDYGPARASRRLPICPSNL